MSQETAYARRVVERLMTDILVAGDLDLLPELVDADVHVSDIAFDGAYEGVEAYRGHVEMLRAAFGDVKTVWTILAETPDSLTVEWQLTGTHEGEFMGVPATGNTVSFTGIDVFGFEDGRIRRIRSSFDLYGLLQDIDAIPEPAA